MPSFATNFATGSFALLTFDRAANPDGCVHEIRDGALRLAVRRGAYEAAIRGEPDRSDRCEVREPGKVPLAVWVRHTFTLRILADFPRTTLRFVAAQLKLNGGGSPIFALRVTQGRLFADWRLSSLSVEHYDRLPACAAAWTRFDLISGRTEPSYSSTGPALRGCEPMLGRPS
ncbi:hypothetical protein [Lichenifustis flavocetrariae]|uniref:Uncharacterized protein n=1 Tax=Lichenifustis flavocetrariae TaxID=2949735 RepID=A0AA41Z3H0_9HYPH|nr:hypothetical protein [Lichenifustis flavocetrariae]MCW6512352.1 hypothetical protein [Lichenifustis flavocetrariae]